MRVFRSLLLPALALACAALPAGAQEKFPNKPVRIIVPYAPGGATDIVSRVLGEQLRTSLGQPFVTENKPGAFGIVAIEEMARAKPDGHTLMVGNVTTNAITPVVFPKKFSINFEKDVVSVARLVDIPSFLIVATKDFPVTSVAEFVAYAKANKGKVRYGSVGVGSYPHYDMALLASRAGLDMIHIPNKAGASGIIKDMAIGDVQIAFVNVASTASMVKAGQLRPIAVVADKRLPDYPDVPTMAEAGFPGVGTLAWQSLLAPAATPKDTLEALHKALREAMDAPSVRDAFTKQGFIIATSKSLDDAAAFQKNEMANWKKITDEVKIDFTE
jgi:tripartite-type tricarboxylate transporter receptor subunit TctC